MAEEMDWEKKAVKFFLLLLVVGAVVMVPVMAVRYTARFAGQALRFVLGLPGRPFGKKWFSLTRRVIWKTNFLTVPPDDTELALWLAAQPGIRAAEITREPYWVVFDCTFRGYFFDIDGIKLTSVRKAESLGYNTGGRIAILDVQE